jgi:hypothetical protein
VGPENGDTHHTAAASESAAAVDGFDLQPVRTLVQRYTQREPVRHLTDREPVRPFCEFFVDKTQKTKVHDVDDTLATPLKGDCEHAYGLAEHA